MRALGLGELDADTLLELRIHDVSPDYVRQMQNAGYTKANASDLVRIKEAGADKALLKRGKR